MSETGVSPPVQRGLEIENEFDRDLTISLEVTEYESGFSGDGYGERSRIRTVTSTPPDDGEEITHQSERTVPAGERTVVDDVITLYEDPRKYYLSVESNSDFAVTYTFISQFGVGFNYLHLTLASRPDLYIVTE